MSRRPVRLPLPDATALRLLASTGLGRIVFSRYALPAISPADHIVDGDRLIVRGGDGALPTRDTQVLTYEADLIDPGTGLGWYVTVTGTADAVTSPHDTARYRNLFPPGISGPDDRVFRIRPQIITGIEYRAPDDSRTD
ncbi:pyridoxamine 5'-phosphate oxidase family protein [Nocardia sp. NPDC004068]|uniref:pyridoxamine 5'-phosphate oxidase family protein n=1 Tax=Nocardia sp. NPDC004068 TaxID=3364303 RepID=UPI00368B22D7